MSDVQIIMPPNLDQVELAIYKTADKFTRRLFIQLGGGLQGQQQLAFDRCLDRGHINLIDVAAMLLADPAKLGEPPKPVMHRVFRITDDGWRRFRELRNRELILERERARGRS